MEATATVTPPTTTTTTASAPTTSTTTQTQSATSAPPVPAPQEWTAGFNDEMKGYVQTKGFKGAQDVLESYRNYEKLQGVPQERLLKLPEDMNSPEARAIWEKLGAPKEAKDYSIQIPKEHGDEKLAEWFKNTAHKNSMTQRQAEGLVKDWNDLSAAQLKMQNDHSEMLRVNAEQNLRKEWGQAFEQNKNMADQGAIALGMGEAEVRALGQSLGPDKAMMLLVKLATATGESSFVAGQTPNNGILAPDQAKNKIAELMADTGFVKRLMAKDVDAMKQWDQAHMQAHPGTMSL